ncbi:hypothetical protein M2175_004203 [Bradyrhizobium elkanii]|uniref:hypothetical protein n=1 Tax=Bradyrhizobium TaxID=374 RepID=UPI0004B062E5|nr:MULTISPECIES: hypothetical protein [Bradyrhizobium]MCS3929172.1 hypothetical protein [Bradyrhizobium elkanii]MCS3969728.1 hypothetical protein [Bradyrhizobium japonicum]
MAKKQSTENDDPKEEKIDHGILAAGYEKYPVNFSSKFFAAGQAVRDSVKRIKAAGFTRDSLLWGHYQKFAATDPTDETTWVDEKLYRNWESSVAEAREALKKTHVDRNQPGPDPDNPGARARNMLEHLDKAVRIALFDKHQPGYPTESGIEIEVTVGFQSRPSRRHKVTTHWRPNPYNPTDPKYKYDKLTIVMTCPYGGWIGPAVWHYNGPSRFTRYTATYEVPEEPADEGKQIIFIFNGLESLPDPLQTVPPAILQPVLQWTKKDGGWAVRSWYVPSTYSPDIDQMPKLGEERKFTKPENPAWTKATPVTAGDTVTGVIEWDGLSYQSHFLINGATVALLPARNILPLTYPVAVIEAYAFSKNDHLVDVVTMNDLTLELEDSQGVPVEPAWEIGTDDQQADGIHYGTGRLNRYTITPSNNNKTLTFTRKAKK